MIQVIFDRKTLERIETKEIEQEDTEKLDLKELSRHLFEGFTQFLEEQKQWTY